MTTFQWSVVLALCRIIVSLNQDGVNIKDRNILEEALDREEN